ncbi:MAG: hypothetical protein Q8Q67_04070 [bacterium]|nr:hypothetical protein [bacterium]
MDNLADLLKSRQAKKAPAYPWQDLALRVITQLSIPNFKRGAVFKVCKELSTTQVERAMNDTKELCQTGAAWKYFFKIADQYMPKREAPIKKEKKSKQTSIDL